MLGALLLLLAAALLLISRSIDWGVAVMVWLPGLLLLLPARTLLAHWSLTFVDGTLIVRRGWRQHTVPLAGQSLVVAPMMIGSAVLLHNGEQHCPLATWISRRKCEALLAWLDQKYGPLPRAAFTAHPLDR